MYEFKREDNADIVSVDFETMMEQDSAGMITLADGVRAKRVHSGPRRWGGSEKVRADNKPIPPSDALGFTAHQLQEFEFDRQRNGFTGVEFVKDPTYDKFYQVKCSSRGEWERYVRHRGMIDKNATSGTALSPKQLEAAAERAKAL